MPVDPMIARPFVPQFSNTLVEIARTKVAEDYRNALMEQERREHAFRQQQYYDAQTQEEEDDREWDTAYAARDWATLARLDPQTTRALMDHEDARQAAPKRDIRQVGGALVEVPAEGDPRELYRAPQSQATGGGADAPADQRLYEWFEMQSPEDQAAFLNMKRSSATPQAAADIAAARAAASTQAKLDVTARADLPRVAANADEMLSTLRALESSKGFDRLWGAYSLLPIFPNTEQADSYALWEQIQGKAFLEAFNTLKGGGQITEKEGEKATAAITRLGQRKQTAAGARRAIRDLRAVVEAGAARAQSRAQQTQAPGVRRFNPATGRIE